MEFSVASGVCRATAARLQPEQQRPHRPAGRRGGHRHHHRHQPSDAEEEAAPDTLDPPQVPGLSASLGVLGCIALSAVK